MNIFRCTPDKSLDRPYLRTCAIYRLLKNGRIRSRARALELLEQRHGKHENRHLDALISIWLNGPLKHLELLP